VVRVPPNKRRPGLTTPGPTQKQSVATDTASVLALLDRLTDPTLDLLTKAADGVDLVGMLLARVLGDKEALVKLGAKHADALDEALSAILEAEDFLSQLRVHLGGGR
jgi:hypothetical protein